VGIGTAHQLEGGQHGLVVLVLMLDHHAVDETVGQQGRGRIELHPLEDVENPAPNHGDVGPRLGRAEEGEAGPVPPLVAEGVVDVVVERIHGLGPGHRPQQPQLLVMADVGQVPHQGRHERRVLGQLVRRRERGQQVERAPPGPVQVPGQGVLQVVHATSSSWG
jgi:hypothetical protein